MNVFLHYNMNHVMRKPVYDKCEQQRRRSACASVQSDKRLCYSLLRYYNTSRFYIQNFKPLASRCSRFESYLVGNPEDRFSHDVAHIFLHDSLSVLFLFFCKRNFLSFMFSSLVYFLTCSVYCTSGL